MLEIDRITEQHRMAFDGDPWYGFPLMKLLAGLSAEKAVARPVPNAHTIWEIVRHVAAWEGAVLRRLRTGIVVLPEEGDWPEGDGAGEEAWQRTLDHLEQTHSRLCDAIGSLPAARLDEMLGAERDLTTGAGHTVGNTLHGIIQHNVYHAGQIALLRKALE